MCQSLEGEINCIENLYPLAPTPSFRTTNMLSRVILEGQLLRFPSESAWNEFKNKWQLQESDYERINHTDPLGFDGPTPTYYENGSSNPKNYLRRAQLPNMKIDMSNVYSPSVTARMLGNEKNDYYVPFLGNIGEKYFPEVVSNGSNGGVLRKNEVVSSLTPKLCTCKEAAQYALLAAMGGYYVSFVVHLSYQGLRPSRTKPGTPELTVITPPNATVNVPQREDCSNPTVGCFWFNDGKNGQIELPKDPECKACVIIKIKRTIVV